MCFPIIDPVPCRREVEIYFSMRHPNIVRVLAFSVNNPEHPPCLVMELMEKSLYNHLGAHETPPPLVDRLGVLHDVCKVCVLTTRAISRRLGRSATPTHIYIYIDMTQVRNVLKADLRW